MINIFNVLHRALSGWSSPPLPHLRCSFRLFSSGSIFSMKLDQFVVVWNWFVLKLFCFRFSLLKNDNKIRSNKKTLKFMHHSILLNKLAFTVKPNYKQHIIAMCKTWLDAKSHQSIHWSPLNYQNNPINSLYLNISSWCYTLL